MKKRLFFSLFLSAIFAFAGCGDADTSTSSDSSFDGSSDSSAKNDATVTLEFFAINDLHGKFDDTDTNCGVDELTTYFRQKQASNPNVVLLSSGDMWQGSSESNLTHGNIVTEWMNDLNFVSMTLGNHEFDWGEENIEQNAELAQFPILGINVYDPDTNERETYARSSVLLEKSGVKIGVIGAIGDCYSSIASDKTEDVYFKTGDELTELVKAESVSLREQGADVVVYSLHDSDDFYGNYYDETLSDGYVDLVFEGHSHQVVQKRDKYGVWHLQAGGDNTTGVSYAKIEVNPDENSVAVAVTETKIVKTDEYTHLADDPVVDALLEKYADELAIIDEVLGYNAKYRNSKALVNFAAEATFKLGYARWNDDERYAGKIVLGGGYLKARNPYKLYEGEVTYGNIYPLFPFDNPIILCKVKGSRLLSQFINNKDYTCFYGDEGNAIKNEIDVDGVYYVVTDTYTANYDFMHMGYLEIVEYYDETPLYTRDALAWLIREGGLAA